MSGGLVDRITAVMTGFHIDPAQSVCGCYELTPEDARAVAERIAELFTEETRELADGMGGVSTNWKTGETTHHFRPCTRQRRWVSGWAAVEDNR